MQIIVLRTVQTGLAEAAGKLNSQAGSLHLSVQRRQPDRSSSSSPGNGTAQHDSIFSACRKAVGITTSGTIEVFEKLRQLQEKLTQQAEVPRTESRMDMAAQAAVAFTVNQTAQMLPEPAALSEDRQSSASAVDTSEYRLEPGSSALTFRIFPLFLL